MRKCEVLPHFLMIIYTVHQSSEGQEPRRVSGMVSRADMSGNGMDKGHQAREGPQRASWQGRGRHLFGALVSLDFLSGVSAILAWGQSHSTSDWWGQHDFSPPG